MSDRIEINTAIIDDVLHQLGEIEQDTDGKRSLIGEMENALGQSSGETVNAVTELNGLIENILTEYETLTQATRILISHIQTSFEEEDRGIANRIRNRITNFLEQGE